MKVLVLESDEKIRSVIQSVLKNGGHEMITAANPDEAIKSLVSGQTRFIIIEGDAQDLVHVRGRIPQTKQWHRDRWREEHADEVGVLQIGEIRR